VKLTTNLHLVPRLRMSGGVPPPPSICLRGVDRESFVFKNSDQKVFDCRRTKTKEVYEVLPFVK
jgi:hypothetical protein